MLTNINLLKLIAPFISGISGILFFILNKYFSNKPKLIAYYSHINAFKDLPTGSPDNPINIDIHTHNIVIKNVGKQGARNVRIGHNYLPDIDISPKIPYKIEDIPKGGKEVIIPVLAPNDEIQVSYLYFPPITYDKINSYIKSDEVLAKIIRVNYAPKLKFWQLYTIYFFLFVGISTIIYYLMLLILLLILR